MPVHINQWWCISPGHRRVGAEFGGKSLPSPRARKLLLPIAVSQKGGPARTLTAETLTAESLARERALRAAVLIDAIRCLVGAGGRERRSRQAAMRWITSRDDRSPFSFANVCESLGFEPGRIRRLLLAPTPGFEFASELALGARRVGQVRRPRRDRARYVVLQGGRKQ
jgi:hypothetical protein